MEKRIFGGLGRDPIIYLGALATIPAVTMPLIVGGLVDHFDFSLEQSANVAAAEFLGGLAGSLIMLLFIGRYKPGKLAQCAAAILLVANLAAAFSHEFATIAALRFISGFGMGALIAIVNGTIARRSNPLPSYALLAGAIPVAGMIAVAIFYALLGRFGMAGAYGTISGVGLLAFMVASSASRIDPASAPVGRVLDAATASAGLLSPAGWAALLSMLFYAMGIGAQWNLMERAGLSVGLGGGAIALLLSVSQIGLIAGSLCAFWVGDRWGSYRPVLAAGTILGSSGLCIAAGQQISFVLGLALFSFGWTIMQSYILGQAAGIDRSGKLPMLVTAMQSVGLAVGPAIAARTISPETAFRVGFLGTLLFGLAAAMLLLAVVSQRHGERPHHR